MEGRIGINGQLGKLWANVGADEAGGHLVRVHTMYGNQTVPAGEKV